ncbi:leucyl/phenylalanyl-tRNA--protein transferase [Rhodothalassium salexigens]|uniref:leucyl/phenylalanyl-tRNA--protein transferase n=1 Tax=Rhodothalassium salexigens TaxID=1086 RepID=UPI0019117898|nr:leucyl/phenylalanyl-tRNA--protein transferase [Rhodothalassium salexigens]MBK5910284.1 leucyl/phenylalanyl-tRNA--protein transferase [Rhodothalassium salexigens]MBK5921508.1 leucyl/phenylalanyl-tRNA--protein transferase [Rhodothalassium salexigens]
MSDITPDLILRAYACGLFPMADDRNSPDLFWVDPESRGILPLERFHLPRSLKKTIRQNSFRVTVNTAFEAVIEGCAESRPGRENTWINDPIERIYTELHRLGAAHSVECWHGDTLAGGLYGVDLAGAFFGESMFHRVTDASKVALAHLVGRLKAGGYQLLDCQFITGHLARFGAQEVPKPLYHELLKRALKVRGNFFSLPSPCPGEATLAALAGRR